MRTPPDAFPMHCRGMTHLAHGRFLAYTAFNSLEGNSDVKNLQRRHPRRVRLHRR